MTTSLSTVSTTFTSISTTATALVATITAGKALYELTLSAMDAIESAASSIAGDSASKKEWVLAYVQAVSEEAGVVWSEFAELISQFIDTVKSLYNAAKAVILGSSDEETATA